MLEDALTNIKKKGCPVKLARFFEEFKENSNIELLINEI